MKLRTQLHCNPQNFIITMVMVLMMSCKEKEPYAVPTIVTLNVKDISITTATCGGYITDNGGGDVITSGLIWSTNS